MCFDSWLLIALTPWVRCVIPLLCEWVEQEMGHFLCEALLDYCEPDQARAQAVLRELEMLYPFKSYETDDEQEEYALFLSLSLSLSFFFSLCRSLQVSPCLCVCFSTGN